MAVVPGLAVALTYGTADFLGGLSSKRTSTLVVVAVSQVVGLVLLVLAVATVGSGNPTGADLALGAAGGVAGLVGLVLLYQGLAGGTMSVVAPTTAVTAAAVPVLWGLGRGERPSLLASVGVAVALAAVALVAAEVSDPSSARSGSGRRKGLPLALGAGVGFGVFFVLLAATSSGSGLWPTVSARAASITLVSLALVVLRQPPVVAPGSLAVVAGAGIFDALANALFVLATRQGLVSLVAVLSSLYPAATVLLARLVLRERLARRQVLGLGLALTGVVLIAGG